MASANPDALISLRQAIRSKNPITYANGDSPCSSLLNATHVVLGPSASFPKSASTRLRKQGVTTASGIQDYHTLEAVYLAWLLRDAPGGEYMKQARENGLAVGFVSVTERKNVVDWLEGKVAEYERIAPLVGMFFHNLSLCMNNLLNMFYMQRSRQHLRDRLLVVVRHYQLHL